jgi:hypothetical protein
MNFLQSGIKYICYELLTLCHSQNYLQTFYNLSSRKLHKTSYHQSLAKLNKNLNYLVFVKPLKNQACSGIQKVYMKLYIMAFVKLHNKFS